MLRAAGGASSIQGFVSLVAMIEGKEKQLVENRLQTAILAAQTGDMAGAARAVQDVSWFINPDGETAVGYSPEGIVVRAQNEQGSQTVALRPQDIAEIAYAYLDLPGYTDFAMRRDVAQATYELNRRETDANLAESELRRQKYALEIAGTKLDNALKLQELALGGGGGGGGGGAGAASAAAGASGEFADEVTKAVDDRIAAVRERVEVAEGNLPWFVDPETGGLRASLRASLANFAALAHTANRGPDGGPVSASLVSDLWYAAYLMPETTLITLAPETVETPDGEESFVRFGLGTSGVSIAFPAATASQIYANMMRNAVVATEPMRQRWAVGALGLPGIDGNQPIPQRLLEQLEGGTHPRSAEYALLKDAALGLALIGPNGQPLSGYQFIAPDIQSRMATLAENPDLAEAIRKKVLQGTEYRSIEQMLATATVELLPPWMRGMPDAGFPPPAPGLPEPPPAASPQPSPQLPDLPPPEPTDPEMSLFLGGLETQKREQERSREQAARNRPPTAAEIVSIAARGGPEFADLLTRVSRETLAEALFAYGTTAGADADYLSALANITKLDSAQGQQ